MKVIFISDIHGIMSNLDYIDDKIKELKCDKLVVLGDLFYIGPANKINEDYDIKYVKKFLDKHSNKIICVRGNCDSNVDVAINDFPISDLISSIYTDGLNIYLTHGNVYNSENYGKFRKKDILVYGHEHTPYIKEIDDIIFINPGSISLSKKGLESYMVYEDRKFTIYDVNDNIIASIEV